MWVCFELVSSFVGRTKRDSDGPPSSMLSLVVVMRLGRVYVRVPLAPTSAQLLVRAELLARTTRTATRLKVVRRGALGKLLG